MTSILGAFLESRASKLAAAHPSTSSVLSWLSGQDTFAGVTVTPYNALGLSAVYAAVRILSEGVAVMSLDLYKRLPRGKEAERDHGASWVVREDANKETSAFILKETLQGHLCTWGNAYAEIEFSKGGEPMGIWQRRPDRVEPERDEKTGRLYYRVTDRYGTERPVLPRNLLHVPGLSFTGLKGFSPVEMQRQSIAVGMAVERYRAGFFGNRTQFSGFIKHPTSLEDEAKEAILDGLEAASKGPSNSFRAAVLDEGMDWQSIGFPNDSAQLLGVSTFQVQDVARWYRIPPHLLAELSHATFTNIEHQDLEFVKYSLLAWLRRWESELNRKLLTERERRLGLFFEFNLDTLLRGDFETRMKGFATGIQHGIISPNEARDKENLNPYEGGDEHFMQINMQSVKRLGDQPVESIEETTTEDGERSTVVRFAQPVAPPAENRAERSVQARWRLREVFERLLLDTARRVVGREVADIRKELTRMPETGEAAFWQWLEQFLERHERFLRDAFGPQFLALMRAVSLEVMTELDADVEAFEAELQSFADAYTSTFARRQRASSAKQIRALLDEAETAEAAVEAVSERLDGWADTRPAKMALGESAQAMNAISMTAYAFAGVSLLRWVWNGGDCGICPNMHGKVVEVGKPFVVPGDRIGDGADDVTPLEVKQVRNHPPLHKGCVCTVAPG